MRVEETVQQAGGRRQPGASAGRDAPAVAAGPFAELDAFSAEVARRSLHLLIPDGHDRDERR